MGASTRAVLCLKKIANFFQSILKGYFLIKLSKNGSWVHQHPNILCKTIAYSFLFISFLLSHQKQKNKEWLKRKKWEEREKYAYLKFPLFYNVSTDNFEENVTIICFTFFLLTPFCSGLVF